MSIWKKIKYRWLKLYWFVVPYGFRPSNIWHKLKCRFVYRCTTVTAKSLPKNCWVDKGELLAHVMFEILERFIKEECSPGLIDWRSAGHTIGVDGEDKNVRDVMDDVLKFWERYKREIDCCYDDWHNFRSLHIVDYTSPSPDNHDFVVWKVDWDSEENKDEGDRLFKSADQHEKDLAQELHDNMLLIVRLQKYLWT